MFQTPGKIEDQFCGGFDVPVVAAGAAGVVVVSAGGWGWGVFAGAPAEGAVVSGAL